MNLVMHMRTGTATGAADPGDNIAALDGFSPLLKQFLCMCILGDQAMAVIDHDEISPTPLAS